MRYDTYRYLYPPRPETAAAPSTLQHYEQLGWWAQAKMNGTCTTIYVGSSDGIGRASFAMGRHGPDNRLGWQPGPRWLDLQQQLPGTGWYVFVGELLHSKGVGVRDTVYLFDLLVDDGEYLVGVPYRERFERLRRLCHDANSIPSDRQSTHTVVSSGVWLAENHAHSFNDWFASIRDLPGKPPVEGLVFKDPKARLLPCGSASANAKGQHKCRRATDHLSF
jgi:hypothetical protein